MDTLINLTELSSRLDRPNEEMGLWLAQMLHV